MDFSSLLASFAAAFSQHQRLLTLQLDGGQIAAEQLLPHTLDGSEGVSQAYRYQLSCLSPDGTIELKSLLGVAARLGGLDADGNEVVRCGVVSRAELLGSDGGFAKYGLTIEPPFALLRLRRTSRVFQDLSVPDIVKQILAEHQANNPVFAQVQTLEFHTASASPRSYCLQYRGSDFDFIVRLLHEEGYAWRFEHVDGEHPQVKLVVFDNAYSLPPVASERVRFHPVRPGRHRQPDRTKPHPQRRHQPQPHRPTRRQPHHRPPLAAQRRPAHQPVCGRGEGQGGAEADCGEGQGAGASAERCDGTDGG
ncbi:putative Vgr-related protein [Aquitalea magnusonii]|uniref:Putative Vgr-related protein n=1 Tax=Aquitalea magnusonii TaxID=332411 RepID=A0A3G9G9C9_9NEIS|nr:putative Vgr-related protein [Aquitalea magnusonii]